MADEADEETRDAMMVDEDADKAMADEAASKVVDRQEAVEGKDDGKDVSTSLVLKSNKKRADPDRWRKIKKEIISNCAKFVTEHWDQMKLISPRKWEILSKMTGVGKTTIMRFLNEDPEKYLHNKKWKPVPKTSPKGHYKKITKEMIDAIKDIVITGHRVDTNHVVTELTKRFPDSSIKSKTTIVQVLKNLGFTHTRVGVYKNEAKVWVVPQKRKKHPKKKDQHKEPCPEPSSSSDQGNSSSG